MLTRALVLVLANLIPAVMSIQVDVDFVLYTDYRLIFIETLLPDTFVQVQQLNNHGKVNLWQSLRLNDTMMLSVSSENLHLIQNALQESSHGMTILEKNLQNLIEEEQSKLAFAFFEERAFNFSVFESYDQIYSSLRYYEKMSKNISVSVLELGRTHRQIDLVGVKISAGVSKKPIVFIECGMNPREWAAISTCLYIIEQLLTQEESSTLLEKYDFHIVPVSNPDGYDHSRLGDRLWQKNRRPYNQTCKGVNLNRNFEAGVHCGAHSDNNPCSSRYCGPTPFSEPESRNLRYYLNEIKNDLAYFLSVHANGLTWTFPHGYTEERCKDYNELMNKSEVFVSAVRDHSNTEYRYGSIAEISGTMTGTITDWAYMQLGVKNSFAVAVQPSRQFHDSKLGFDHVDHGFMLASEHIAVVGEETFVGLKALWLS